MWIQDLQATDLYRYDSHYVIGVRVSPYTGEVDSVDSPPRRENGSPRFGGLHLLGERVETPRLPPTS